MSTRPQIVILGGGFGGLDAAKRLRKADADVIIIDRHNHHVFQPLLYQVATAALSPGDIASPIRWILRRQANVRVLLATVTSVDTQSKTITLDDGTTTGTTTGATTDTTTTATTTDTTTNTTTTTAP